MTYTGSLLPAFSNLPIYNAAAIIPVEPDPPPVDPEPTPIFATEFTGLTLTGPEYFVGLSACSYHFTGTDTETNFGPPTGAPIYALSGAGYWGAGYGVQVITSSTFPFASTSPADVNLRHTIEIVPTTVRGEATNAIRLKWKAPGSVSYYSQQSWFMFYRNTAQPDLTEITVRFEVKIPDLSVVLPSPSGLLTIIDYKTAGDFRYWLSLVRSGGTNYFWQFIIDSKANGSVAQVQFCGMTNYDVAIPQEQNATLEFSFKRARYYSDVAGVHAGKARIRIRRESDSVTTWTTLFDASESGIAAYNALHGTSNINRHQGIGNGVNAAGFRFNRLMHGNYGHKANADCAVEIAKYRMFDTFNV